jgi:pSer/pThr/pTyr-binding forkhead associated (FHA) protein
MAKIQLFLDGQLQGQYPLDERYETRVGRSTRCDIVIQNPDISRHHCTFRYGNGQWMVEDAHSVNGTLVNGENVKERILRHTDRVGVGLHTLMFDQYGHVSAESQVDSFQQEEGSDKPSTVLLYRDELRVLLESGQKGQSMALVLAASHRVVVPLVKETTRIGSDWECDLRIGGLLVKPVQALVVKAEEGHSILHQGGPRDLYLNGRKIRKKELPLKTGDVVEIAGNKIFYGIL